MRGGAAAMRGGECHVAAWVHWVPLRTSFQDPLFMGCTTFPWPTFITSKQPLGGELWWCEGRHGRYMVGVRSAGHAFVCRVTARRVSVVWLCYGWMAAVSAVKVGKHCTALPAVGVGAG